MKSRLLHLTRWQLGFNPSNFMITTSQTWIRIHQLPLEFHKEQNVLNIAGGVGLPLKIDPLMLNLYHGMYARVLVVVDLSQLLPKKSSWMLRVIWTLVFLCRLLMKLSQNSAQFPLPFLMILQYIEGFSSKLSSLVIMLT